MTEALARAPVSGDTAAVVAQGTLAFVGRHAEIAALGDALRAAKDGRGSTWLLAGEPGIGKTRLIEEVAREAQADGFVTLWGRCWEAGGAPAFWPWIQVVREALRHAASAMLTPLRAAHLVQLVPELRDQIADVPESPALVGDNAQFMLLDAVTSALCAASRIHPLLIALDDLHVATPSSLLLLELLAHHARGAPIVIVGSYREADARASEAGQLLQRIAQTARTLVIARLAPADIEQFLDRAIGRTPSRELVATVSERTDGNPLFLVELSRLVIAHGTPARDAIPPTLRTALQHRIEQLSPPTREILELASVLGRDFAATRVAGVFARKPDDVHAALDDAEQSAIVLPLGDGSYRFRHILLREVLHGDMQPARRQALHFEAARWLEMYGVDRSAVPWSQIAHHYFAAGDRGREPAIDALERAADQAVETFAFAEAIIAYRSALQIIDLGRNPRRRAELMIGLGHAQLHGGDPQAGRDTCLAAAALARELAAPELLARAALELGSVLTFGKVDPVLVALLEEALGALGREHDRLRARVMSRLAAAQQPAEDPRGPIAIALEAVALARTTKDPRTLLATLGSASSALIDVAGPADRLAIDREHVTLATALGDRPQQLRGQLRLALACFELGDATGAHAAAEATRTLAERLAHPFYTWRGAAIDATLALWEGRFLDAQRAIDRAHELGEQGGDPNAHSAYVYQRTRLARLVGDRSALRAGVTQMSQLFADTPLTETLARVAAAAHALQLAPTATITSRDLALAHRDRASYESAAEIVLATGNREVAAKLLARLAGDRARCVSSGVVGLTWDAPLARVRALLERTLGDHDAAIASLDEGLAICRELTGRPMIAWLADELASWLVERDRAGDRARARVLADEAEALARELGMTSLIARIEAKRSPGAGGSATELLAPRTFALERSGDAWTATHAGASFQLRDGKGLRYLARLVAEPRCEVHALDLADALDGVDGGDAGELLDARAREQYRQRVRALEDDRADAEARNDLGAAERATTELEAVRAELARAFGLGGRARRAGGAAERARINVQRRLRAAIAQIAAHDPALARHLERSIRTGVFCSYQPD
jgi:tetratricopeptide (TPR) repeat protein